MPRFSFDIVGEYNVSRSVEYDSQDTINLYIVIDDSAKKVKSLQPMPGLSNILNLPLEFPIRPNGLYTIGNRDFIYAVCGNSLYKFNESAAPIKLGNINTIDGLIRWANSPSEIGFVDGANLYSYNINTGVFSVIPLNTADGYPSSPQMIYWQDARFILSFENTPIYIYSGFSDSSTGNSLNKFDPNNTFIQQSRPSVSVGISGTNERLFLFGDNSVESWAPFTTPNLLPFYRDNNFIYEFGCAAIGSIVKGVIDNQKGQPSTSFVSWLSSSPSGPGTFVLSTGGTPIRISTDSIDLLLRSFSNVSDCISTVYKESAHIFIENTFPSENKTLTVDLNTGSWIRSVRKDESSSIINSHVYYKGKHYVGSRIDSSILELSQDYFDEAGQIIPRSRSSLTFIDPSYKLIQAELFEVDFEAGIVEPGIDPVAFLSISYDGGRTYGSSIKTQIGRIGQYRYKAQWFGLGMGYSFTFKIEFFEAIRVFIFGAALDYKVASQ